MTGSGIGGASAAIAPDDNTAPEQYTVTLPVYEACEYQYETSHKRENPDADQEIVLQYEPGTQVSFDVAPGDGWSIDKMQLFGNKSEIPLMIANQTVRFSMPEEDVIFRAEFHRLAETDAGALEETRTEWKECAEALENAKKGWGECAEALENAKKGWKECAEALESAKKGWKECADALEQERKSK